MYHACVIVYRGIAMFLTVYGRPVGFLSVTILCFPHEVPPSSMDLLFDYVLS